MSAVVLVADDSGTVRSILRRQLRTHGFAVVEAEGGREAILTCRQARPDLVLLDVDMPDMDGFQVLAVLKSDPVLRDTPVIFLTGQVETHQLVEGLDLGAYDYVKKPCDGSELAARIRAGLREKARSDELRRRNDELDGLTTTDGLTGLRNRRALERHAAEMTADARRTGTPLSVLLLDIDHFKRVNDEEGHSAGDAVLRTVSERLTTALRPDHVLGRWGGEEFMVLAPATDRLAAQRLAERLRTVVGWEPVPVEEHRSRPVTISVGVTTGSREDADELVRSADAALYAAKHAGRDRVVVAPVASSAA